MCEPASSRKKFQEDTLGWSRRSSCGETSLAVWRDGSITISSATVARNCSDILTWASGGSKLPVLLALKHIALFLWFMKA
jgi:hypothetical protein